MLLCARPVHVSHECLGCYCCTCTSPAWRCLSACTEFCGWVNCNETWLSMQLSHKSQSMFLLLQEEFENMASKLFNNSISCPDDGWTMLGPGNYGPDAWAMVQTSKGKRLTIFLKSKLHTGSAMPQPDGQHLGTMSVGAILGELRKDVSKCYELPATHEQPLEGPHPNRPICKMCSIDLPPSPSQKTIYRAPTDAQWVQCFYCLQSTIMPFDAWSHEKPEN